MLRKLVLVALLTSALVQNAALNSSASPGVHELRSDSALARAFAGKAAPGTSGFDSNYKLSLPKPVQDKNFYLLSLFQRNPGVRKLLSQNEVLKQLAAAKASALKKAASCNNVGCFDELIRFDGATIAAVAAELQTLANRPEFKLLAKKDLRPSGVFIRYDNQSDTQMLVAAWKDAANGMNRILSVYGLGKDPRYKDIDRVSYDVSTERYRNLLKAKIAEIKFAKAPLFFEPTLNFALTLLEINRRDEAGRYEPLEQGENKAAVQSLSKIKWSDYPYTFILVLGSGGRDLTTRISPIGAQRTDVAAQLFSQHKAPLIIVSGGFVHPMQTPYCEAIEMKKYLMERYKIPETSILIEPHARHTTTNFRNAARLAFRYRIPTDRTALVTSSEDHIASSTSEEFRTRNLNELGYFPVEFIKRISPVEAEFQPSVASLFFDANDPLDP
ncbi:MAG TPA: YdcF family protein [Pyrinomonadaceae bacterium]|nr:YdcF family protein [Pyrinomonadaceae bacterium]